MNSQHSIEAKKEKKGLQKRCMFIINVYAVHGANTAQNTLPKPPRDPKTQAHCVLIRPW